MLRSTVRAGSLALVTLALLTSFAGAQAPPPAAPTAGTFTLAAVPEPLRTEILAGLEAWRMGLQITALDHANRALAIDSTFGLARALRAVHIGGATRAAEMSRAVGEAMSAGVGPATLALAMAFNASIPTRQALARMYPNDRGMAHTHAVAYAGAAGLDSLRALTQRFPDYVPSKIQLALDLTPSGIAAIPPAIGDEALRVAQDALRLAPNASSTHAAVGHVLERLYRHDEAMVHLRHATAMTPPHPWAHVLIGEIAMREGRSADARAALEAASRLTPGASAKVDYARAAAMLHMADGDLRGTLTRLEALARDAEAAGLRLDAAECYLWAAHAASGDRNNGAAIERYITEAARLGYAQPDLGWQAVYAYGLTGDGPRARRTLEDWTVRTQNNATAARANRLQMMTGLTLLAEGKADEAIAQLAPRNLPYSDRFIAVGLIEAYKLAGRTEDERAARAALLARMDVRYTSTAVPIFRYRMATNR